MCISFKIRAPDLHVTCNGSSISKADRRYWTDSPGSSLRVFLGGRNGKKSHAFLGNVYLVGGFNPFEKYESNWTSSSNEGENGKYLKPSPGYYCVYICILHMYTLGWAPLSKNSHHQDCVITWKGDNLPSRRR